MRRGKRHNKKSRGFIAITQCEKCHQRHCRESKQQECARLEIMALAEGGVYECSDLELGYLDRLAAA